MRFKGVSVGRDPNEYSLSVGEMARIWREAGGKVHLMPDLVLAITVLVLWVGWLVWRRRLQKTLIQ